MAKKRKEKTEDEEFDFKVPKFDEQKFLKKERRNIRTLFISFLFGLIISLLSFGFWTLLVDSFIRWELVLLLGVFNASWLKFLFLRLNIDLTDFGRKEWFSTYAIYFFTWLILLIILVNPPFYDDEAPQINIVALPGLQEVDGTVTLAAQIIDNVEVKNVDFSITTPNGTTLTPNFTYENNILTYTYTNEEKTIGEFTYTITATDTNDHTNQQKGSFDFTDRLIDIISNIPKTLSSYDSILIQVNEDISNNNFRVYYTLDDGREINVSRKTKDDKELYETTAEYIGWKPNTNMTMQIYIEVSHYFKNLNQKFSNTIQDSNQFNITVGDDANIGTELPLVTPLNHLPLNHENQPNNILNYYLPTYTVEQVPGFETLLFFLSLIVVALIVYKKKKTQH